MVSLCALFLCHPVRVGSSNGMVSSFEQASQLLFCSVMFKETLRLRPPGTLVFLHNMVGRPRVSCREYKSEFGIETETR